MKRITPLILMRNQDIGFFIQGLKTLTLPLGERFEGYLETGKQKLWRLNKATYISILSLKKTIQSALMKTDAPSKRVM